MNRYAPFLGLTLLMGGTAAPAQTPKKTDDTVTKTKTTEQKTKPKPVVSKGVMWKFLFEKGRTTKFKEKITFTGNQADGTDFTVEMKAIQTETVRDVSKTGDGTIETRSDVGEVTKNGEPISEAPPAGGVTVAIYDKNGILTKRTPAQTNKTTEIFNKIAPIALSMPTPSQAVEIGDEWKNEFDNPFLPDQKVVVTSQYVEQGKFGTLIIYRIQTDALIATREDDEENADAIHVSGTYEFEPVKRRVVKSDIMIDNVDIEIQGQKARASVHAVLSMIGTPDQLLPKNGKVKAVSSNGKRKKK